MSASFLVAAGDRGADMELNVAIAQQLLHPLDEPLWRIARDAAVGRRLVAARDIPAGTLVFQERPLVVAESASAVAGLQFGPMPVAAALLRDDIGASSILQANPVQGSQFQSLQSKFTAGLKAAGAPLPSPARIEWAIGLASTNTHASSDEPRRSVLGVLSSMMEHACNPTATISIGPAAQGSTLSLHTQRDLRAGEPLSISYTIRYAPTAERRRVLLASHGFLCRCERCDSQPEWVRAFRCPVAGCEGAASPLTSLKRCRRLVCDECIDEGRPGKYQLDDAAWAALIAAEECETLSEEVLGVLHPYHHKMVVLYIQNLAKVPLVARSELFCQFADANARLTGNGNDVLVAKYLQMAAHSLHSAGEHAEAAEKFGTAAEVYAAALGATSEPALRCRAAERAIRSDAPGEFGSQPALLAAPL